MGLMQQTDIKKTINKAEEASGNFVGSNISDKFTLNCESKPFPYKSRIKSKTIQYWV